MALTKRQKQIRKKQKQARLEYEHNLAIEREIYARTIYNIGAILNCRVDLTELRKKFNMIKCLEEFDKFIPLIKELYASYILKMFEGSQYCKLRVRLDTVKTIMDLYELHEEINSILNYEPCNSVSQNSIYTSDVDFIDNELLAEYQECLLRDSIYDKWFQCKAENSKVYLKGS